MGQAQANSEAAEQAASSHSSYILEFTFLNRNPSFNETVRYLVPNKTDFEVDWAQKLVTIRRFLSLVYMRVPWNDTPQLAVDDKSNVSSCGRAIVTERAFCFDRLVITRIAVNVDACYETPAVLKSAVLKRIKAYEEHVEALKMNQRYDRRTSQLGRWFVDKYRGFLYNLDQITTEAKAPYESFEEFKARRRNR